MLHKHGPTERYVSRQRLVKMLDHEYDLLLERLDAKRGESTKFFAFADTAAARSFTRREETHGWMGIRDLIKCARGQFAREHQDQSDTVVVLTEMTLRHLAEGDVIDPRDVR